MTADTRLRRPLDGLRVLDASRVLAGPLCGQLLGDLGADVIKVEDPTSGDETRAWGPPFAKDAAGEDGLSAYFLSCNRNKRSVALNLKAPSGRAAFLELVARSDVVLENFRGESKAQLGLSVEALHAANPRAVVCTISGYGSGPVYGKVPGYDFVVQALSGLMASTGPVDGEPYKTGVAIADVVTGLYTAIAALSALHARQGSGHGYAIDVALIDCAAASMVNVLQAYVTSGHAPRRVGNAHLQIVPYELFRTADGWLVLAVGNDRQWRAFCAAAERSVWADDARFKGNADRVRHRSVLVPLVREVMAARSSAEWRRLLDASGVPNGPVWSVAELLGSDLARERRLTITARRPDGSAVELVRSPLVDDMSGALAPPALGEHTERVLRDVLGYTDARIAALRQEGAV